MLSMRNHLRDNCVISVHLRLFGAHILYEEEEEDILQRHV